MCYSSKRIRVVCPTAVAAINIGGSTIHSLFNLPLSDFFIFDELYVALSRTRHKADIHIPKRIDEADIIIDDRIVEFLE